MLVWEAQEWSKQGLGRKLGRAEAALHHPSPSKPTRCKTAPRQMRSLCACCCTIHTSVVSSLLSQHPAVKAGSHCLRRMAGAWPERARAPLEEVPVNQWREPAIPEESVYDGSDASCTDNIKAGALQRTDCAAQAARARAVLPVQQGRHPARACTHEASEQHTLWACLRGPDS